MGGGVSQVDAGEISRRAANTDNRFARFQAANMDLEWNHTHQIHVRWNKSRLKERDEKASLWKGEHWEARTINCSSN